jgi:hypothetical protein
MILQRDEVNVNVNVRVNRMRNWLSKLGETINENLTGCLQWHLVVGYETKQKYLLYTTNNMVLNIIPQGTQFWFSLKRSRYSHFYFLKNLNFQIHSSQSHIWIDHNSWCCQEGGKLQRSLVAIYYGMSAVFNQHKHQIQGSEKLATRPARADERTSDRVVTEICCPWIWKKTKTFIFER